MNIAIIFAGGRGERLNNSFDFPKQFLKIDGKEILIHTLLKFEKHAEIDKIYIAVLKEYMEFTHGLIEKYGIEKVCKIVEGGSSAQESIYNALISARLENNPDSIVLIHDGVRPVITDRVISDNISGVKSHGTAVTVVPCYETIIESKDGRSTNHVPIRKETFKAQAPQSFRLGEILEAHEEIRKNNNSYQDIVDSCTLFNKLGRDTHLVAGNFGNIKVTTPEDVYILRGILEYQNEYGEEN